MMASTPDLTRASWRKSTYSGTGAQCVEVAAADGVIAVRDSKDPTGPALCFTAAEFATFLNGTKDGEFDPA